MYHGKFVFTQLMHLFPRYEFDQIVRHYQGNKHVRSFNCWHQFQCLCFGHLTHRESLRDIITCLEANQGSLYHMGLPQKLSRSTFSDANRNREWRIFADYGTFLIEETKNLYANNRQFLFDLNQPVYALDGSVIELCLSLFPWAKMHTYTAAVRLHLLLDAASDLPHFAQLELTPVHELEVLRKLTIERGAIYVMDRGYLDWKQLNRIQREGAFFVIRCRSNTSIKKVIAHPVSQFERIIYDDIGIPMGFYAAKAYPQEIRSIKVKGEKPGQTMRLLTNLFDLKPTTIEGIYKKRWRVELFFKWIKQHLKIKAFWGRNENAVKAQIWAAICTYLLVAIVRKKLNISRSMYEILQILSVSPFRKVPLNQILKKEPQVSNSPEIGNQLKINGL